MKYLLVELWAAFLFAICTPVSGQVVVEGDVITVEQGARLVIMDSLRVTKVGARDAILQNNGKIILGSNLKMQPGTQITGSGNICFTGKQKRMQLNGVPLPNLEIDNNDSIRLLDPLTVSDSLTLTSGFLILDTSHLYLDSNTVVLGGNDSSYIRISGTGKIKATVGVASKSLPMGRNPYLPVVIAGGGGAQYTVGVQDQVYQNPDKDSNLLTTDVVSETWTIQASEPVTDVSVSVGWNASEEESGFSRTNCYLSTWESGVSNQWNPESTSAATGSGPYYQTRTMDLGTNVFFLGVGGSNSALPVELIHLDAHWLEAGRISRIEWTTASEINNHYFRIERSWNGRQFDSVGMVVGAGTTSEITEYEFFDHLSGNRASQHGVVYYRLRQVDFDGSSEYSDIVALQYEERPSQQFVVYPNPSNGNWLYVKEKNHYTIRTLDGRTVAEYPATNKLNVMNLRKGVYLITNSNGAVSRYIRR